MQLRVGGRYLNRDGREVTIVKRVEDSMFPFRCNEGRIYTEAGYREGIDYPGGMDLVSDIKEEVTLSRSGDNGIKTALAITVANAMIKHWSRDDLEQFAFDRLVDELNRKSKKELEQSLVREVSGARNGSSSAYE